MHFTLTRGADALKIKYDDGRRPSLNETVNTTGTEVLVAGARFPYYHPGSNVDVSFDVSGILVESTLPLYETGMDLSASAAAQLDGVWSMAGWRGQSVNVRIATCAVSTSEVNGMHRISLSLKRVA